MTNDSLFTLPVALINVESGNYGAINYGLLLAGSVIAMIPCVVAYVALQRYYVRGLVSGALKADAAHRLSYRWPESGLPGVANRQLWSQISPGASA